MSSGADSRPPQAAHSASQDDLGLRVELGHQRRDGLGHGRRRLALHAAREQRRRGGARVVQGGRGDRLLVGARGQPEADDTPIDRRRAVLGPVLVRRDQEVADPQLEVQRLGAVRARQHRVDPLADADAAQVEQQRLAVADRERGDRIRRHRRLERPEPLQAAGEQRRRPLRGQQAAGPLGEEGLVGPVERSQRRVAASLAARPEAAGQLDPSRPARAL